MLIAPKFSTRHELEEEFLYHKEEASYHLEQYLRSQEEMERHYKSFKEHAAYRDEFGLKIKEDLHGA